jgi:hypothetical protein
MLTMQYDIALRSDTRARPIHHSQNLRGPGFGTNAREHFAGTGCASSLIASFEGEDDEQLRVP